MRVLFLNDSPVIRWGLASGFRHLGHQVDYLPRLWKYASNDQIRLSDFWLAGHDAPDLVLFEGLTGGRPIHPAAINRFRRAGALFVYWAIEDPLWTDEIVSNKGRLGPYAMVADHIFTPAMECVDRYDDALIPSSVLLFGIDPYHHQPVQPCITTDVVLVANYYHSRTGWLTKLLIEPTMDIGADLVIFGHGWETAAPKVRDRWRGPLDYADLPAVYAGAKVALGAEQCLNQSSTQSSMRVFEVLGCGGAAYLGPNHRAHRRLFISGKHLLLSSSRKETTSHLELLLGNEHYRRDISQAGRAQVLAKHTYDLRAQQIINTI